MEEATKYFESVFENFARGDTNSSPKDYLLSRGLNEDTIKLFRIGFAPAMWRSVSDFLIEKGFKEKIK